MSLVCLKIVTYKLFITNHIYFIFMHKHDLALNNLQELICHKTQPINQHTELKMATLTRIKVTVLPKYCVGRKLTILVPDQKSVGLKYSILLLK